MPDIRKALKYIRPLNFYRSDKELYEQIAKGPIRSCDMLKIEYGEFPPKGLTIDKPNTRLFEVKSHFQDPNSGKFATLIATLACGGYVHSEPQKKPAGRKGNEEETRPSLKAEFDRAVYINHLILSPIGQALALYLSYKLGTVFTDTVLSQDTPMQSVGAVIGTFWFFGLVAASSSRFSTFTGIADMMMRSGMTTVGHEHAHIMQAYDGQERKTGFSPMPAHFRERAYKDLDREKSKWAKFDDFTNFGRLKYYLKDTEVQARLHTVLVHNYPRWERMPLTKHEFWAAMIDSGLNAPEAIKKELEETPTGQPELFLKKGLTGAFNRVARKALNSDVAELNIAHRSLQRNELRERHWQETLPYLYGHLLELYGHKEGRKQMGFLGPLDYKTKAPIRLEEAANINALVIDRKKSLYYAEMNPK